MASKIIAYDKEQDILTIHKGFSRDERFKGNIDVGDIVLDISTKGRIRGIEIMDASHFFKDFRIPKTALKELVDAQFQAQLKPNAIMIGFFLKSKSFEMESPAKVRVPLQVPSMA